MVLPIDTRGGVVDGNIVLTAVLCRRLAVLLQLPKWHRMTSGVVFGSLAGRDDMQRTFGLWPA